MAQETSHHRSYFYIGGEYVNTSAGHILFGQMYVEKLTPVSGCTKPYPIIFIHGRAQTGTVCNFLHSHLPNSTSLTSSQLILHRTGSINPTAIQDGHHTSSRQATKSTSSTKQTPAAQGTIPQARPSKPRSRPSISNNASQPSRTIHFGNKLSYTRNGQA